MSNEEFDDAVSVTRTPTPAESIVSLRIVSRGWKEERELTEDDLVRTTDVLGQMDAACSTISDPVPPDGVTGLSDRLFAIAPNGGDEVIMGSDGLSGWYDGLPYPGDYDTSQALLAIYDELEQSYF